MCLFLNDLVFRVNKKKKSVDTIVDTLALEPRGFEPCQRCKRKKTYTHAHARVMRRVCVHVYIYLLFTYYYYYYRPALARVSASTIVSTFCPNFVYIRITD